MGVEGRGKGGGVVGISKGEILWIAGRSGKDEDKVKMKMKMKMSESSDGDDVLYTRCMICTYVVKTRLVASCDWVLSGRSHHVISMAMHVQ